MKTQAMEQFLEGFTLITHGRSRKDGACVTCGSTSLNFRNALSLKEYSISKMCQECQDDVFGVGD